jgi:hypothetical protein
MVMLAGITGAAPVDYLREVKPLFSEHCFKCHGAVQQKGGLRMDTAAFLRKGGQNGPGFVPGKPAVSLMVQVIDGSHDDIERMPYKRPPLSHPQIALLKAWVAEGGAAPADEKPEVAKHWAFIAPQRPEPPKVKQASWPRNGVDGFILARLEKEGLQPSPEADRVTLIRRLSLDLTGLPPSPSEVDAFVADNRPSAYALLVERLLASPHYGERWGRVWLDVARYADSNGYSIDAPRSIWKYRDWVISAIQRDLPYDQFVIEQLAGDLFPNATIDQRIATGFHRNTQINQEGGIDREQFRIESIFDRVATTGTAFLGLTIGCAQCHDHKFDPISQREYYQFLAFFNNADEPEMPVASPAEIARANDSDTKVAAYIAALPGQEAGIWEKARAWEMSLTPAQRQAQSEPVRQVFDIPADQRKEPHRQLLIGAFVEQAPENKRHQTALAKLRAARPKVTTTLVMQERAQPRETTIFIKGDFTRRGDPVRPGTLGVLQPLPPGTNHPTRLDLARWIVSRENALAARVMVNRVWQQYFGRGLVETENDFGTQGLFPSHPELLDELAVEFMAQQWSLKALHRLIVGSATYRQSSRVRPELAGVDANNRLLARQSRLRLDGELVRDTMLAASGLLHPAIGGPSVYPPIPDGVMSLGQVKRPWPVSTGGDRYRRGLYTFFFRATPPPSLVLFDTPDAFSACTHRIRSNTPLQALTLLNDQSFVEFAQALAGRVLKEAPKDEPGRIEYAFRLCLARRPNDAEARRLKELLAAQAGYFASAPQEAKVLTGQLEPDAERAAWTMAARVLLNLDETITRE